MPGKLKGQDIMIEDEAEASQIYNKGYYGSPQSGGSLKLNLIEAIYLTEAGKLKVQKGKQLQNLEVLFRLGNKEVENFEINYAVYRDLRQRGYVVKKGTSPLDFRVLPRGGIPGKEPSKYWVLAMSERSEFDAKGMIALVNKVKKAKKTLLLAIVDEESDITYDEAKMVMPNGRVKDNAEGVLAEALMLQDRVLVLDECEAQILHNVEFFGKLVGSGLQLSLLETAYLLDRGHIKVKSANTGKFMRPDAFKKEARKGQPDFDLRLQVYSDLKEKGVLVKTGFKYGSHFRAYTGDPESNHAKYLIHSLPSDYVGMWAEVSRAVRLAHGVKKEILLGHQRTDKVEYLRLKRIRP